TPRHRRRHRGRGAPAVRDRGGVPRGAARGRDRLRPPLHRENHRPNRRLGSAVGRVSCRTVAWLRRGRAMSHSTTEPAVTTGEITSADGTRIGYRILGSGPGVVLLHGAMSSGYHHLHLARLLADRFTAYLPDRRGRGLSGPYRPDDGLDTEVEDLAALLADPARAGATLARFERALAAGDVNRALAIAMKGAQMGLALLRAMPDALLVRLTAMAMRAESRKPSEYVPMSVLAPALRHDLRVVATLSGQPRRFSAITADVLLDRKSTRLNSS